MPTSLCQFFVSCFPLDFSSLFSEVSTLCQALFYQNIDMEPDERSLIYAIILEQLEADGLSLVRNILEDEYSSQFGSHEASELESTIATTKKTLKGFILQAEAKHQVRPNRHFQYLMFNLMFHCNCRDGERSGAAGMMYRHGYPDNRCVQCEHVG